MKAGEIVKRLNDEGWELARTEGSHRQYTHPDKPGRRVTVYGRNSKDLPIGTVISIYRQAGWEKDW